MDDAKVRRSNNSGRHLIQKVQTTKQNLLFDPSEAKPLLINGLWDNNDDDDKDSRLLSFAFHPNQNGV